MHHVLLDLNSHNKTMLYGETKINNVNTLSVSGFQHDAIVAAQHDDNSTSDLWHFMKEVCESNRSKLVCKLAKRCFVEDGIIYRNGGIFHWLVLDPNKRSNTSPWVTFPNVLNMRHIDRGHTPHARSRFAHGFTKTDTCLEERQVSHHDYNKTGSCLRKK